MVDPEREKKSTNSKFESVTYIIPGPPAPWSRVAPDYRNRRMYDTQKNLKLIIGIELSKQHDLREVFEGPLQIDWRFYLEIPPTLKKKRELWVGKPHSTRPDISNLIKFYEDVANKILFNDDCQIARGSWSKLYDDNPRTEFTITRL